METKKPKNKAVCSRCSLNEAGQCVCRGGQSSDPGGTVRVPGQAVTHGPQALRAAKHRLAWQDAFIETRG